MPQDSLQDNLEIALNGKRYTISLEPLHAEVKNELRAVFTKEVEPITLLKLYITKAQEYALICQSLERLYASLENIDTPTSHIHIQAMS
ncbi:hypothetical protein LS71_007650 [Helicobacter jaachi]|uniref:Uncharacterized protein n=1 Tax=Helicobacter jaachi TaxID=1677920 RepID=A0A4U8TBV3_9HELI|nr:hypothetical protein [Helicobacter jaachi]TLD96107.1 hypothetical protein LS71_007650 [Helicobacter jaachi]